MEQELNAYLERVDRYLRPMSAWERVDIVQEIRSEILELAEQGLGAGAIMERLGAPRELAAAYLRDAIVKNPRFSWRRLGSVIAFYSLAGLGGMIVLPASSIMARPSQSICRRGFRLRRCRSLAVGPPGRKPPGRGRSHGPSGTGTRPLPAPAGSAGRSSQIVERRSPLFYHFSCSIAYWDSITDFSGDYKGHLTPLAGRAGRSPAPSFTVS